MELLLQAIEKKLANVDSERKRWLEYKTEHEQAGNNLREFQKSFRKEILVPIGSKALIPGHLYHTNEILVSMYRGLFVKCSSDKALSVCEHRIGEATKRIDALNVEDKMYRDRLELPADENVFANLSIGAQEIIEEYNEENEKKWREQHKISMRAYKQAEAEERKRQIVNDDIDIDAILEQAELMEELESELEQLNVSTDEHLQQHLRAVNGENGAMMNVIDASEKSTYNHTNITENDVNDEDSSEEFRSLNTAAIGLSTEDKIKFYEIHLQQIREYFSKNTRTIANINEYTEKRVTQENLENAIEELRETDSDSSSTFITEQCKANKTIDKETDDVGQKNCMESVQNSNEPRKFHTRSDFEEIERQYATQNKSKSELLVFYKGQLSHIVKLMASCTASNVHTGEQKRDLYEFLSDRISSLREEIQKEKQIKLEDDFVDDDDIDIHAAKQSCRNFDVNSVPFELDDFRNDENGNSDGKRKINFAPQPSVITFFEDDEPCIVSQQNENNLMDATFEFFNSPSNSSASSVCDDEEDNKNVSNDSDSSVENSAPHSDSPCKNSKRQMNYTNDCDMNFPMNRFNECTMNNKAENSCSNVVNSNATILKEVSAKETAELAETTTAVGLSQNKPTTLVLKFNHSSNACTATVSNDDTINSPLDIYRKFGSTIDPTNDRTTLSPSSTFDTINRICQPSTTTMDQKNTPKLKLTSDGNDSLLYDAKTLEVPNINQKPSKSILKKKNLVEQEIRASLDTSDDIEDDENGQLHGYPKFTQVLGEIVEHSNATESNTISAQSNDMEIVRTQISDNCNTKGQPKKRVSLFKKSRMS